MKRRIGALAAVLLLGGAGCMTVSTNVPVLSDASHLGTPYSGVRVDLHVLICFGKNLAKDPSTLLLTPLAAFHLLDLPFSAVADTLLLPADVPLEPEAAPLSPGAGACKLVGL